MTNSIANTEDIRQALLANIKDASLSDEECQQCLARAMAEYPQIFEDFAELESIFSQQPAPWSVEYFQRAKQAVLQNFSVERIGHLLDVRAALRRERVKGFAPKTKAVVPNTPQEEHQESEVMSDANGIDKFLQGAGEKSHARLQAELMVALPNMTYSAADLEKTLDLLDRSVGICQPYAVDVFNKEVEDDQGLWNEAYFDEQMAFLRTNFSRKRFLHLLKVREYLSRQGVAGFEMVVRKQQQVSVSKVEAEHKLAKAPEEKSARREATHENERGTAAHNEKTGGISFFRLALLLGGAIAAVIMAVIFGRK
ncbi:hypothetical protein CO610_03660 [Lysobacteraceae bacterium NML95-0200]|nr:hypothetical protein CO610_03660 [Xanthomonadaceae bacterium NML95-0200]